MQLNSFVGERLVYILVRTNKYGEVPKHHREVLKASFEPLEATEPRTTVLCNPVQIPVVRENALSKLTPIERLVLGWGDDNDRKR